MAAFARDHAVMGFDNGERSVCSLLLQRADPLQCVEHFEFDFEVFVWL